MNNVDRYNDEIKEYRNYLSALVVAMNEVLKSSSGKKNDKILKTQKSLFEKLNNKSTEDNFYKFYSSYLKKTDSNLKKLSYAHISSSKIEEILRNDRRNFDSKIISKIENIIDSNVDLKQIIKALSSEFNQTIKKIQGNKKLIKSEQESEKERQQEKENQVKEYNKPQLTEEELEKQRIEERIDRNSNVLLNGPKSGLSFGKDKIFNDMKYLYGLAMDIFVIMDMDQNVNIKNLNHGEEVNLYDVYIPFINDKKSKIDMILNAYGVNNIEALLNKYDKIQKTYYKKFSKLSKEKQDKYNISNFESYSINSNFEGLTNSELLYAFKNKKFSFPPSKEILISAMNQRIMNGKNYELVSPKKEEVITGEAKDFQKYLQVKEYYKNLTKNMTVEEVSELYKRVVMDMQEGFKYSSLEPEDIKGYYATMQKMFCEVIFDKKDMEIIDSKQHHQAIKEIATTNLKEDLKFSIYGFDKVTEDEQQKRQLTVEEEYVRYRAQMTKEGKKEHLSFREFSKQKYNITNVVEPQNIEKMIDDEIKGMKR